MNGIDDPASGWAASQHSDALLAPAMRRALDLAQAGLHLTAPNPSVGCVITSPAGDVLGEGRTQAAGSAHAEVMALQDAAAKRHDVRGATAWVTLEPCAHHGRTGPCCDAIAAAGIARVVASIQDPNPLVAGQGFARLKAAGVALEVGPGAADAREVNIGFFSRMVRKQPWVRMKIAASLDGATALQNGKSQWITSPQARADGHAWRARGGAVLTGIGTVLADNPLLDVRLFDTLRQPALVIVDSRLDLPLNARLFEPVRQLLVYTASSDESRRAALVSRGAQVMATPSVAGKVDLSLMLADLAQRGINEVHVEAGHKLNGSLVRAGLVDEFLVYLAPMLLGSGQGMTSLGPLTELAQGVRLAFRCAQQVGPDLRVLARVAGRDDF